MQELITDIWQAEGVEQCVALLAQVKPRVLSYIASPPNLGSPVHVVNQEL